MPAVRVFVSGLLAILGFPVWAELATPLAHAAGAPTVQAPATERTDRQAARPLDADDVSAFLAGFMPFAMRTGDIAGAVVVVVKDGEILVQRGFGFADTAKQTPVDPERTLFRMGSVSKLFTWTAVMQLVGQGKLDLDADVNRYLDFRIPDYRGQPITLRQILTHTAGFEEQIKGTTTRQTRHLKSVEAALKGWIPNRVYAPGTTPAYSNYATSLAGYIVQRVSKEPFETYVERHIFSPLGMERSTFRQPLPAHLKPLLSQAYNLGSGPPSDFEFFGPVAAASLVSTGTDMGRFMIAHLRQGEAENDILPPAMKQLMHRGSTTRALSGLNGMELGFYESDINGREVISHSGDTQDFHSDLNLFLDENVGIFVSMNSSGRQGAASTIRTALFEQFSDRYFPAPRDSRRVAPDTSIAHARMLVGTWSNTRGSFTNFLSIGDLFAQVQVTVDSGGRLRVSSARGLNGGMKKWVEVEPFVWMEEHGHDRLAAQIENGRAVRFSFGRSAPFRVFERTPWYRSSSYLTPALFLSVAVLLLGALALPVSALIRRRYRIAQSLGPLDLKLSRISSLAAFLVLAALAAWILLLARMFGSYILDESIDPFLIAVRVFTIAAITVGMGAMVWNVWVIWRDNRRWAAKVWSLAMLFAVSTVAWVSIAFHLVGFGVKY